MNKDKICALVMPACAEFRLSDILKLYWIERRGIDVSGGYPNEFSHNIGFENNSLADYQTILTSPYYFVRYYNHSPAVVSTATLIADANTEDMTVVRLTRDNIIEHAMDFFTQEYYAWQFVTEVTPGLGLDELVDTQAEVDILNTEAQSMIITDSDLARFKVIRDESNAAFDIIEAAGVIDFTYDYDDIPWDNPRGVLSRFFPDPNVPTDTVPLRRTILTPATQAIVNTNNDLTNRINLLFV